MQEDKAMYELLMLYEILKLVKKITIFHTDYLPPFVLSFTVYDVPFLFTSEPKNLYF